MPTLEELTVMTKAEKRSALITASENGDLGTINSCIQLGLNITYNNNEAIRQAAYHGQLDVIKLLVANDADIHAQNEWALTYAATCHSNNRLIDGANPKQGNFDVVVYLIENGADINVARESHPARWHHLMDNIIREYLANI